MRFRPYRTVIMFTLLLLLTTIFCNSHLGHPLPLWRSRIIKGVFRNTKTKNLVGWAGQMKIFGVKLFEPPLQVAKLFDPSPLTCRKTFLTPSPQLLGV